MREEHKMKIAFRQKACELFLDIYDVDSIRRHVGMGYKPVVVNNKYQTHGPHDLQYTPVVDLYAVEAIKNTLGKVQV